MKVLVAGANGKIGRKLVDMLQDGDKHTVKAMVRKKEQAGAFKEAGVETVLANLEDPVNELAAAAKGCDAIVFTAGSGGSTGPDKTLLVDLDGAVKMMEAAGVAGIKRFVIVSALQADNRENWNEKIKPYYVAKYYADLELMRSSLDYTIVRPGGLLDDAGTGKVTVGKQLTGGSIPREDVARIICTLLDDSNSYRRAFDVVSGDTDIADALQQLA
ncbi:SDR family oxidoreductase [Virgibacillus halophilus]|uniref:SDR family oxidoreductase n=1 Tax=Tigheibacillus halophilus TaxID=361280 RepID=A0ABU5C4W2_9BACI|nr:SDR family oxidoreductase [Virgibacillus halophilus]